MGRPLNTRCKQGHLLEGDNLYISPKGARGCRTCRCLYSIQCHKNEPEKMRGYRRKHADNNPFYYQRRHYGITHEQFKGMLAAQEGLCAICLKEMKVPHIDHNHETKQVRDLLCSSCNLALGHLHEDVVVAERLIEYLKKWGQ